MRLVLCIAVVAILAGGSAPSVRAADDKDATALIDKGIKSLGGADKLARAKGFTWKGKSKISFGDNDVEFATNVTIQGLDHMNQTGEGDVMGNAFKAIMILDGDKGWRAFAGENMELDKGGVANLKRNVYLQVVPTTLLPLKEKGFKVEKAGEEKVGDKPAVLLKITGPDGKDFKLYLDKETGLPVKEVAKVTGFMGDEFTQETTFSAFKDFGGIKKATKIVNLRDGQKFMQVDVAEFSALEKVDAKLFAEPK